MLSMKPHFVFFDVVNSAQGATISIPINTNLITNLTRIVAPSAIADPSDKGTQIMVPAVGIEMPGLGKQGPKMFPVFGTMEEVMQKISESYKEE